MGLDSSKNSIIGGGKDVFASITTNPIQSAVIGSGVVLGGAVLATSLIKKRKKKAKNRNRRKRTNRHRSKRKRYTPHTAGKGKDRSHKRIRYTKKGQPYVIMASGKARFIKKSGARRSHRTKGGRY